MYFSWPNLGFKIQCTCHVYVYEGQCQRRGQLLLGSIDEQGRNNETRTNDQDTTADLLLQCQ